ncbi:hypothetical protein [Sphingomonas parva]|uniref:hypothetical protein n=1 Tax=Sphingomonas parva TaxID=2555898 RepID=UPI00143218AD|nr:hypothetical protein [Sphingomonas parva]
MSPVERSLTPADERQLRQQARERLSRAIDIWLAHTVAGGSANDLHPRRLRAIDPAA